MIYLFTKPDCKKCDYVKDNVDVESLDEVMDITTVEGLATLAWHELCGVAETQLPILLVTDKGDEGSDPAIEKIKKRLTGAIKIKNYLTYGWKK